MVTTWTLSPVRAEFRPFCLAVVGGLACALLIGKALPATMDAIENVIAPLCAVGASAESTPDAVEPIASYALPNLPGKRVTIVRLPARIAMPARSPPTSPRAKSAPSLAAVPSRRSRWGSRFLSRRARLI